MRENPFRGVTARLHTRARRTFPPEPRAGPGLEALPPFFARRCNRAWGTGYKRYTPPTPMEQRLITSDPAVMMGKPVVAGETVEQLLAAHPRLTREAVQAALAFAAEALRADVVYPASEA